jgi:hypothetical protein
MGTFTKISAAIGIHNVDSPKNVRTHVYIKTTPLFRVRLIQITLSLDLIGIPQVSTFLRC